MMRMFYKGPLWAHQVLMQVGLSTTEAAIQFGFLFRGGWGALPSCGSPLPPRSHSALQNPDKGGPSFPLMEELAGVGVQVWWNIPSDKSFQPQYADRHCLIIESVESNGAQEYQATLTSLTVQSINSALNWVQSSGRSLKKWSRSKIKIKQVI